MYKIQGGQEMPTRTALLPDKGLKQRMNNGFQENITVHGQAVYASVIENFREKDVAHQL